jgi:predicted ABC-type sugar transport system permease subunit
MSKVRLYSPALVLALWAVAALALGGSWLVSGAGVVALTLAAALHLVEWDPRDR